MADVSVSLDLEAKQLYSELQTVQSHFAGFAAKATAEGEKAGRGFTAGFRGGFGSIGTNLVQGIAALGIGSKITEIAAYGSRIQDLSERFGVSTDALQKFGNAAELSGSSLEGVAKGFRFLEVNQAKALAGDDAQIKAFADLGVSFSDLQTLSPEQIFLKLGEGSLNAADLVRVLGKSALELRPLLEGIAAGTISLDDVLITPEGIKKLDELDDKLKQLHKTLTVGLGEGLSSAAAYFQAFVAQTTGLIVGLVEEFKGAGSVIGIIFSTAFKIAADNASGFLSVASKLISGNFLGAFEAAKDVGKGSAETAKAGVEAVGAVSAEAQKKAGEAVLGGNIAAQEFLKPEVKAAKVATPAVSEDVEYDEQGQPIAKKEKREAKKEESEAEKARKEKVKEEGAAQKEAVEKDFQLRATERAQRQEQLNPAGLSLKDFAEKGSGHVAALGQEAVREEKIARERGLVGDTRGAKEHQDRAEQLKRSLGLPNKLDQADATRDGLDKSAILKKIEKNTAEQGKNK